MVKFFKNNIVFMVFFGVAFLVFACVFVAFFWGFRVTGYYLSVILLFLLFLRVFSKSLSLLFAARSLVVDVIMLLCGIIVLLFFAYYAPG